MKENRKYIYYILIALIVVIQLLMNKGSDNLTDVGNIKGQLEVDFIDVGQGDSILVQSPTGINMLIDAGDNSEEKRIVEYLKDRGITRIDYLIGTHPHADHIGGLDAVIREFEIGDIYMPKVSHTTKTFKDVLLAVKEKGYNIKTAKAGVNLDLGEGVKASMIAPISDKYNNMNNYSAVISLSFGETSFLFTGDAEKESENEMINSNSELKSDVLKLGHHGSNTSTTDEFLDLVSPKYGVIFSKQDNSYGHPHKEIIEKLEDKKIKYYDTQEDGTIIAVSDGKTIKWSTQGSSMYSKK